MTAPTAGPDRADRADRGFHPLSIGHLVLGLALLGMSAATLLYAAGSVDGHTLRWLIPVPWVVAGTVGLTAVGVLGSRRHTRRFTRPSTRPDAGPQTGWVNPTDPPTDPSTDPPTEEHR